ncbi:MAG TPA: hypothetical protein VMY88_07805 [Acidimicrobiales bacterium]|nr:hypothetical protein [Acidimicrobiales bacterium]
MLNSPMRGKWAAGIVPRNFAWVIKGKLAVAERPGGHGANHRPVRRMEEIIWLKQEGFSRVVSLLPSPHNLHAYSEHEVPSVHVPFGPHADPVMVLGELYPKLREWMGRGDKLLIHQEEVSDRVMGVIGGYLLWTGMLPNVMQAINVVEQLMARQMGSPGRELVAIASRVEGSAVPPIESPVEDLGPLPPPKRTLRRPVSKRPKNRKQSAATRAAVAAKKSPVKTAARKQAAARRKAAAAKEAAKDVAATKAAAKAAAAKQAAAKKATAKKAAERKAAAAKKVTAEKAATKKAAAARAAERKATAKKLAAKKAAAKKASADKRAVAKKAVATKTPAKKQVPVKKAVTKKAPAKAATKAATKKTTPTKRTDKK